MFTKKTIFILLISLLIKISSFSQTISTPRLLNDSLIVISLPQLKKTNLIFLEHKKLKQVNILLNNQNQQLLLLNNEYSRIDSIQKYNLQVYSQIVQNKNEELQDLQKALNTQKQKNKTKNYIIGGAVSLTILTVLISVLK